MTDRDTRDTTGQRGRKLRTGTHWGYINDDGDTGNIRLAITINKGQGQSLEKCGIDLNTDCFPMDNYMLHVQESVNLNNLFICTDNGTAKNIVYSQVLHS